MSNNTVLEVFHHGIDFQGGADIAAIEGVRGLYEGLEGLSDIGSTAQIAKILDCPVILVINARTITRSAAALVMGYKSFDPKSKKTEIFLIPYIVMQKFKYVTVCSKYFMLCHVHVL